MPVLREVVDLLDGWYDPATAEQWDAVGLVLGDPEQRVENVMLAVDPAPTVAAEAVEWGADLLVCHHPLFLRGVHGFAATTPKGRTAHLLAGHGVALLTAHTNADLPADGVNEALARAVGIVDPEVLVPADGDGLDKLVVFVPHENADALREAITSAGAGMIGDYDTCTFTGSGEGRFRPGAGAHPAIGRVGEVETVPEARVETVLPRRLRAQVVAAMRAAHPYEEPAYDVYEVAGIGDRRTCTRGHGRIGELSETTTLHDFADRVAEALPTTAHGVRISGDPDRPVRTVAVGSGAGDYLLDAVRASEADVYLTSDLRHHPASEFREHARGRAGGPDDAPALVDVAHWAAEWTWLPVVEAKLREALADRGDTVGTRVSTTVTDPWTFRA
ncbi:MAG TPA: Nif3-like dinuclear metal center hexameric protein [Nocardioidaceae bacterium]|nr:Nif3-like dinuclear metal center hexameric protein [Nocardioidaceae bacterium]